MTALSPALAASRLRTTLAFDDDLDDNTPDSLTYSDMPPPTLNICRLRRVIRRMAYDDLLTWGDYDLEYLCPMAGFPYYRLARCDLLVGIVDLRAAHRLPELHHRLALYLDDLGWQATETQQHIYGAYTPPHANKHRIPHLFRLGEQL